MPCSCAAQDSDDWLSSLYPLPMGDASSDILADMYDHLSSLTGMKLMMMLYLHLYSGARISQYRCVQYWTLPMLSQSLVA